MTIEFLVAYVTTAFEEAINYYNELTDIPNPFIFQDDMLFESQFVRVRVGGKTKSYYERLLDETLSLGQEIDVPVGWLSKGSSERVSVVCPRCEEIREVKFDNLMRTVHSFCNACSKQRKNDWMLGQTFGRLTVLRFGSGILETGGQISSTFICKCECGNEVEVRAKNLKVGETNSCGCYQKQRTSETNYNPNLTDEERVIKRNFPEYRQWRKAVFERDNYTCQMCFQRGGELQAHHLNSWASNKELRFDLDNGLTLCEECHTDLHFWNGGLRNEITGLDCQLFSEKQIYDFKKILNGASLREALVLE